MQTKGEPMRATTLKCAAVCLALALCVLALAGCGGTKLTQDQAAALVLNATAEQLGLDKDPGAYTWFIIHGTKEVSGKDCYTLYAMVDGKAGPDNPGFAVTVDGSGVYTYPDGEKLFTPTEADIQAAVDKAASSQAE